MSPTNQQRTGLLVPARMIPTPRTVSPEAQVFLSNPPLFEQRSTPDADDKAGWRAHVEQSSLALASFIAAWAERYPVNVVTHALSTAPLYELTPSNPSPRNEKRAILYVHGGGFTDGAGRAAADTVRPAPA